MKNRMKNHKSYRMTNHSLKLLVERKQSQERELNSSSLLELELNNSLLPVLEQNNSLIRALK